MSVPSVKKGDSDKQLRSGTVNAGYEYEELVPAYFALKLLFDENVKSFSIDLNPSSYRKFDDVVITVKIHNTVEKFAIQLKHRVDGKNVVNAPEEFYRRDSKNKGKSFNIYEYLKAYNNVDTDIQKTHQFILFTNTIFDNLEHVSDHEIPSVSMPFRSQFLNVNNICQFRERKKRDTPKFYEKFFLIHGQENVDGMQRSIEQIFANKLKAEPHVAVSYINFFKQLHNDKYEDTKITRDVIILNLTRLLLSNYTITPCKISRHPNSNIDVVEEIIKLFDLVILSDIDRSFIETYWKCISSEEEIKRMDDLVHKLKYLRKMESLNDEQRTQLVPYLTEKPLFVEFSKNCEQQIYSISTLLKTLENYKIKLVLVSKTVKIKVEKFEGWKIFENLNELAANETLHEKFTHVFNISLQGREPASIHKLKNSLCLEQFIRPSDLFHSLKDNKGTIRIGNPINPLPKVYIPRNLLRTEITLDVLGSVCSKYPTVIHCNGKSTEFGECLKIKKFEIRVINIDKNKIHDLQSKGPFLILTDKLQILDEHKHFYHFKLLEQNVLQWIDNKVDPKIPSIFKNDISLVYGEPGIGKTTMMTYLAHQCPPNYWIAIVPLQQKTLRFKDNSTQNLTTKEIKRFLIRNEARKLDDLVIEELLAKKKIMFFFDGLNELNTKFKLNEAINIVKGIADQGFKIWISCTHDFKNRVECALGISFCYTVEHLTEEHQQSYIYRSLTDTNVNDETRSSVIRTIEKNNDILKLPLNLYILTQILSSCKDIRELEQLLTVDKMYASFIEGKLQHNLKKIGCNHLDQLTVITDVFKDYCFSGYKIAALQTCLEPELFKSLNVQIDKKFLQYIKRNGDYLEFIKVNEDHTFTFTHYTFAEYFGALWLSENINELSFDVKNSILHSRYDGIRRFFDAKLAEGCPLHLAIIEQNVSKVEELAEKCLHDIDRGGRTPLHLAVTFGKKYPLLEPNENELSKTWEKDSTKQEQILTILLNKVPIEMLDKPDKLLEWNSWEYADAALCLSSLEQLSKKGKIQWDFLKTHYQHLITLSYYCTKMGYKNLLKVAIDKKTLSSLENKHQKRPLLHMALENNQPEIAKLLIDYGSNTEQRDDMNRTPLQEAAIWGHTDLVKLLLQKGVNVNVKDSLGRTALHIAAKRGFKEILQILIEKEADINSTDNEQKTPLHGAARSGRTEAVKYLVEKGANIDATAQDENTPLHQAAKMGHYETVKSLVEKGAKLNDFNRARQTPLSCAAQEGHKSVVNYLISKGVDIFAKNDDRRTAKQEAELRGHTDVAKILRAAEISVHRSSSDFKQNELQVAAENGELEILKRLLNSGGHIEETNENDETLLHIAASHGRLHIIQYLLTEQANTDARNRDNRVPLHLACQGGHVEVVKELLNKRQMGAVDRWKLTPLHRAAFKGRTEVVKVLVEAGADVNCCNSEGGTPLHSAARGGHIDVLKYLISQGVDIKTRSKKSNTCLHVAVQRGCTDAVEYLIHQNREFVHDIDYIGRTALHFAVEKGHKNMVRILIEGGSDVNKENSFRETALHIAKRDNREEIIELLKKNGATDP